MQLILVGVLIFAMPGAAQSAPTTLLLPAVDLGGSEDPLLLEKVIALTKAAVVAEGSHRVVEFKEVPQEKPSPEVSEAERTLKQAITRAGNAYLAMDYARGLADLRPALERVETHLVAVKEFDLLVDGWLTLGILRLAQDDKKGASDAFVRALQLRPERRLVAERYPPHVIGFFNRVADELNRVPVLVESRPGLARILLDGQEVGRTPLQIQVAPGRHQLMLHLAGRTPERSVVVISESQKVSIPLQRNLRAAALENLVASVVNGPNLRDALSAAAILGREHGSERVLVVGLRARGDNVLELGLALVDVATHKRLALAYGEVDRTLQGAPAILSGLVRGLEKSISPTSPHPAKPDSFGAVDPEKSLVGLVAPAAPGPHVPPVQETPTPPSPTASTKGPVENPTPKVDPLPTGGSSASPDVEAHLSQEAEPGGNAWLYWVAGGAALVVVGGATVLGIWALASQSAPDETPPDRVVVSLPNPQGGAP
jgi:hypothetical protein